MQIFIDAARCSGHGRCYDLSPGVYSGDDEGYVAQKGTTFTVGAELADAARRGADACPEAAISVQD